MGTMWGLLEDVQLSDETEYMIQRGKKDKEDISQTRNKRDVSVVPNGVKIMMKNDCGTENYVASNSFLWEPCRAFLARPHQENNKSCQLFKAICSLSVSFL